MRIALTGHRPNKLGGYDLHSELNMKIARQLREYILEMLRSHQQVTIISGMALGADTLWALVALKLRKEYPGRVLLHCAIPCAEHYSKWNKASTKQWQDIVDEADSVYYVSNEAYTDSCMQDRNIYMVDNCDLLVAVWDGTKGGTGNCVVYAKEVNKEIVQFNPKEM